MAPKLAWWDDDVKGKGPRAPSTTSEIAMVELLSHPPDHRLTAQGFNVGPCGREYARPRPFVAVGQEGNELIATNGGRCGSWSRRRASW